MRAYIEGAFIWADKNPSQASLMMAFYHLSTFKMQYRQLHDQIRTVGQQRLAAVLEPHLRPKSKAADKSKQLSMIIQAVVTGNVIEVITCRPKSSVLQIREDTVRAVMELLHKECG